MDQTTYTNSTQISSPKFIYSQVFSDPGVAPFKPITTSIHCGLLSTNADVKIVEGGTSSPCGGAFPLKDEVGFQAKLAKGTFTFKTDSGHTLTCNNCYFYLTEDDNEPIMVGMNPGTHNFTYDNKDYKIPSIFSQLSLPSQKSINYVLIDQLNSSPTWTFYYNLNQIKDYPTGCKLITYNGT
jgi:hypothetical protein